MSYSRHHVKLFAMVAAYLVLSFVAGSVCAQGLPQSPYSAPSILRELDLAPSNPLAMPSGLGPRGLDSIYLNSEMFRDILPLIPNLQVGYLYSFGNHFSTGRLSLDYLQPIRLGSDSAVFVEAHGESTDILNAVSFMVERPNKACEFLASLSKS